MPLAIDTTLGTKKAELIKYFRNRASESLGSIKETYGTTQFKKRASAINREIINTKENLFNNILQKAKKENWQGNNLLDALLMVTYSSYVIMLEYRNTVWPYEYMAFSRRIGEIWEPFCKLCFEYPVTDISLFVPPLFSDVRKSMTAEIEDYIDKLEITSEQKSELKKYYRKVWALVTSGEIKLELDCHFEDKMNRYNIDFKSGFGSNEKGNTNRLLLVATIYKNLEQNYKCVLLVRSEEDLNNHYFQTLKKSGIWEACCGQETYKKIREYTGYDLGNWITNNIKWKEDLSDEFFAHLETNNLDQYLIW